MRHSMSAERTSLRECVVRKFVFQVGARAEVSVDESSQGLQQHDSVPFERSAIGARRTRASGLRTGSGVD
jgi:hypothetical protein